MWGFAHLPCVLSYRDVNLIFIYIYIGITVENFYMRDPFKSQGKESEQL